MENHMKILDLLNQKQVKENELEQLVYGSVEIRDKDNKNIFILILRKMVFNQLSILVNILKNCTI